MNNLGKKHEYKNLQDIGNKNVYGSGINKKTVEYSGKIFKKYIEERKDLKILELGPAEGIMTDILYKEGMDYTIVEAVEKFCEEIKQRHENIKINNCLFEYFNTQNKYDVIILGHVLEHVENPVEILSIAKKWLSEDGIILAAVPNANSIHRKVAVLMNILSTEDELGETDYIVGHRRVYKPETFKADFLDAGLKIEKIGGYCIKPLTNKQIEENWTDEMVDSFMQLGEYYPDIAAEIYIVAKN